MVGLLIDLRAAFDSIDREVLIKAMRERNIREGLINRIEEAQKENSKEE